MPYVDARLYAPYIKPADVLDFYTRSVPAYAFYASQDKALQEVDRFMLNKLGSMTLLNNLKQQTDTEANLFDSADYPTTLEHMLKVIPTRAHDRILLKSLAKDSKFPQRNLKRRNRVGFGQDYRMMASSAPDNIGTIEHDVIVAFAVYCPIQRDTNFVSHSFVIKQLWCTLGSEYLTDLKDVIQCSHDEYGLGDCSEHLFKPDCHISTKKVYKSSLFFLGDDFYDDLRQESNKPLSNTYAEWCEANPGVFTSRNPKSYRMENSKIADISVQLGKPYLYLHVGNCEHPVVVVDIQLLNKGFRQDHSSYPICIGLSKPLTFFCIVCRRLPYKWIVTDADCLLPLDPAPLCDVCLKTYLYDENNEKIDPNFKVFRYFSKTAF